MAIKEGATWQNLMFSRIRSLLLYILAYNPYNVWDTFIYYKMKAQKRVKTPLNV